MTRAEQQAYADLRALRASAERIAAATERIAEQMALWGIAMDRVATLAGRRPGEPAGQSPAWGDGS